MNVFDQYRTDLLTNNLEEITGFGKLMQIWILLRNIKFLLSLPCISTVLFSETAWRLLFNLPIYLPDEAEGAAMVDEAQARPVSGFGSGKKAGNGILERSGSAAGDATLKDA